MAPPVPPTEGEGSFSDAPQGETLAANNTQSNGPRSWEQPWTLDQIRREAGKWSLAGDAGLLHMLQEFSQRMIARTHEMEKEVNGLVHEAKLTGVRLSNVTNDFIMLANAQFVENRVYDEDVSQEVTAEEDKKVESKEKTREQREAELIPKVSEALKYGIDVIDHSFEKLDSHVADSDSEDEESGYKVDPILEAKDPYITRPLPCLIGSARFMEDDHVGLTEDVSDEEAETDNGTLSESETERNVEDLSTDYSDSEDEAPRPVHSRKIEDSDQSESESEESESDEDMFVDNKKKMASGSEIEDESEEEKGDEEGTEKEKSQSSSVDFAAELAKRIGASIPQKSKTEDENDNDNWRDDVQPTRKESRAKSEEKKEGKKGKEKTSKTKEKHTKAPDLDEEDDLFGSSTQADDDGLFSKPGGLFSSSKGLFDEDDDEGGLFGEVAKPTKPSKKTKAIDSDTKEVHDKREPAPISKQRTESIKKIPPKTEIFGSDEDDLFTASVKSEEKPETRKPTLTSSDSNKLLVKTGGGGGGLFDEEEDEDDLFSSVSSKSTQKAQESKKPVVQKADVFEDDDENGLFSSIPASKPAEPEAEVKEKPKATEKKLPAGAVSMFGGANNPLVAALKKRAISDSEEEQLPSGNIDTKSNNSVTPATSVTSVPASKASLTSKSNGVPSQAASLFVDDDDDDLFSPKSRADSKIKGKAPIPEPKKAKAGGFLFGAESEDGKEEPKTEAKKTDAKKDLSQNAVIKNDRSGLLFGADEEEDDLFAAISKPKDSGKKKPAGGVSLFGDGEVLGTKSEKQSEPAKKEAPAPAPKSTPQKKMVSLFDADEEDKDLFGAPPTTTSAPNIVKKERSKSKGLFDDEDVLFGTPEESPSVDIFHKTPPAPAEKPKSAPAVEVEPKKSAKPATVKEAGDKKASQSSDLFQDENDDLFSIPIKASVTNSSSAVGVTKEPAGTQIAGKDAALPAEPEKHKKPAGAVSMFGGLDPSVVLKNRRAPSINEENSEDRSRLKTEEKIEEKKETTKPSAGPPPIVMEKPNKAKPETAQTEDIKHVTSLKVAGATTLSTSTDLFADDDDDLFSTSAKPPVAPSSVPIKGVTTSESTDSHPPEEVIDSPKPAEPSKPKKPVGGVSMFGGIDPLAMLKKKPAPLSEDENADDSINKIAEKKVETTLPSAEKPVMDKSARPAALFGDDEAEGDLFGKSQTVTITKPVPIVAPKAQRPKVDIPITLGSGESPSSSSPQEGPKALQTGKPPLSPPSDTKPFKKPVGGISMFGGTAPPLGELKKRTPSQSEDVSKSTEIQSDTQPHPPPSSGDELFDDMFKSSKKPVSSSSGKLATGRISNLQKNLGLNPAALLPGATPPIIEPEAVAVGFEDPADVNTLQSAAKDRPKVLSRRRPQSRKARHTAALSSGISFEDSTSPTTPTSPDIPPVLDQSTYITDRKAADLFGNDDLFAEEPPGLKSSAPVLKSESNNEDIFKKGIFIDGTASKTSIGNKGIPDSGIDDLFGDSSVKPKKPDSFDNIFGDSKLKVPTEDIFGDSKLKVPTEDIFGSTVSPKDVKTNIAPAPAKDIDEDDLFSSSSLARKDVSSKSKLTEKSSSDPTPTSITETGSKATKLTVADDDDIFADSSLNKKKDKSEQPSKVDDIFVDNNLPVNVPSKAAEDSDIFASESIPVSVEKKRPKKASTKDESLFKDDTDIFSDLPAAKPKENKKKKKTTTEKKGIFKEDVDDIFAETTPVVPKAKKDTKKKSAASLATKEPTAVPTPISTDNIFEDPLNSAGK